MDGRAELRRLGWHVIAIDTDWDDGYVLIHWRGRCYVAVSRAALKHPEMNTRLLALAKQLAEEPP